MWPNASPHSPTAGTANTKTQAAIPGARVGNRSAPKVATKADLKAADASAAQKQAAKRIAAVAKGLEPLAKAVVDACQDQTIAQSLKPHMAEIAAALVIGAKVPGSTGAADRSMLLRLARHPASTAGAQLKAGKEEQAQLGALLERALAGKARVTALVEGVSEEIGRTGVTASAVRVAEPA